MGAITPKEKIIDLIHHVAEKLGYSIYEISVMLRGENSKIMVKIDHLKGISHSDCEIFSKHLNMALDGIEFLPNYYLEVSSPGVNREIRTMQEFIRFAGAPVKVQYLEGGIKKTIRGILEAVSDDSIQIRVSEGLKMVNFSNIVGTNLDY
ncbi:MAG: hypothetical protein N2316_06360 [Spirochaetes bacterium]|nr:hypothetical protein [Spirochaetota bacterium]